MGSAAAPGIARCQPECSESTLVSPGPDEQNVANTIWRLATLGWQAADGAMRKALEGAAVRVAPSMNAQNVARPRRPSSGMETATRRSRVAKTRAKRHVECSPTIRPLGSSRGSWMDLSFAPPHRFVPCVDWRKADGTKDHPVWASVPIETEPARSKHDLVVVLLAPNPI